MATWQKSHPDLVTLFWACVPVNTSAQRRQMFGYPCLFVNGNMAVGLHEQRLVVRLPALAQSQPFIVLGRRMLSYGVIEDALDLSPQAFKHWVEQALAYTASLPPKEKKAAKKAAPKTGAKTGTKAGTKVTAKVAKKAVPKVVKKIPAKPSAKTITPAAKKPVATKRKARA